MIRGVEIARGHESDRITAVATELGRLGLVSRRHLTVWSCTAARHCTAAGSTPTVTIASPWPSPRSARSCPASSSPTRAVSRRPIPRFFDDVARLGVGIR